MTWAPDYLTDAEIRSYVRIAADDEVDTPELRWANGTASRAVDLAAGRQFGNTGDLEPRTYPREWSRRAQCWVAVIDDLMTTDGFTVTVDGTAVAAADYTLKPRNSPAKGRPWTHLFFTAPGTSEEVDMVGLWGWTEVPTGIKQATAIQMNRFFARRNSPYGVAGSPDDGSELRLLTEIDADAATALGPFRRWWVAA